MANYNSLKATIDANVKQNGVQAITGQNLNAVLNQMVNTLGAGYQFAGVATITTNPGSPDAKVFYIANGKGIYTNFGGINVTEDDVVVLYWDTAWHKEATGIASQEKLTELESAVSVIFYEQESLTPSVTIGKYIFKNGSVADFGTAQISEPIAVNAGDTISFTGVANDNVSMISLTDASGSFYTPVVIGTGGSSSSSSQTATYTSTADGYVALCSLSNGITNVTIKKISKGIKQEVEQLNADVYGSPKQESLTPSVTTGKYIFKNGSVADFGTAQISEPIAVNAGDTISFTGVANDNVAMISLTDASGSSYTPVVIGTGNSSSSSSQTATYTSTADGYVALCSLSNGITNVTITPVSGIINKLNIIPGQISLLSERVDLLSEEVDEIKGIVEYSVSMFEKVSCCGDSYVSGHLYSSETGSVGQFRTLAWGSNLGRLNGVNISICAQGGATTKSWLTDEQCLPKALNETPSNLYIFCLGINDSTYVTKGTINDITDYQSYEDYPDTFYGNYGKIIEQIQNHAPNARIIIMTPCHRAYINWAKTPIIEITQHYGIAMIDTSKSKLIMSDEYTSRMIGGHPTAALHGALAIEISKLIGNCIKDNYDYFKNYFG